MDRSVKHAFDAEEIMAYLDGELEPATSRGAGDAPGGLRRLPGNREEFSRGFRADAEL